MTEMTPEKAAQLRAPFAPEQIGKLPKPTKRDNEKGKCSVCGGYHGLPAVHLDYVGHAATTDRLLQVDPDWTWAPMAYGEDGLPKLDAHGGLWIWLTVCGIQRPGYGDSTAGKGMKELIGDAIRNAAMRFGVALDLWAKEDLSPKEEPEQESERKPERQRSTSQRRRREREAAEEHDDWHPNPAQLRRFHAIRNEHGISETEAKTLMSKLVGKHSTRELTKAEYDSMCDAMEHWSTEPGDGDE